MDDTGAIVRPTNSLPSSKAFDNAEPPTPKCGDSLGFWANLSVSSALIGTRH